MDAVIQPVVAEAAIAPATLLAGLGVSALGIALLALLAIGLSAYLKIATVLGLLRAGIGFQSIPSAFVTGVLALSLAFFVMAPTLVDCAKLLDGQTASARAPARVANDPTVAAKWQRFDAVLERWRVFLQQHAHPKEVARFAEIAQQIADKEQAQAGSVALEKVAGDSWRVLVPAFVVSELKEAFATGLTLFLPFLVIELLVANVLLAIGLTQLNPVSIALPLKLFVFLALDGWAVITSNLVRTYAT